MSVYLHAFIFVLQVSFEDCSSKGARLVKITLPPFL